MEKQSSFYGMRGVSATKPDVKAALRHVDPGLFPGSFCKIVPDLIGGSDEHCLVQHSDGAGTKSALAHIHYRRHGDATVFKGIAQDSLVMNLDDMLCVGVTGPFAFSNTIGRNVHWAKGEVIEALIAGYEEFAARLRNAGIPIYSTGGETADLGDLVRTVIADSSIVARLRRDEVVDCSKVEAGHVIVGLSSTGRATYETVENSGVGTNGLTALRHSLLSRKYAEDFPETFAPELGAVAYIGNADIDDPLPGTTLTLGEACLSPTRTYAPVVRAILGRHRAQISAMFHNTGGGQTKCLGFGRDVRYVKDNLFPLPPLFELIRRSGHISLHEMLQVFNMGHRFEIVCDRAIATSCIGIAAEFGVQAQVIGHVERAPGRSVKITTLGETHEYSDRTSQSVPT